jgi:hypothetical protein
MMETAEGWTSSNNPKFRDIAGGRARRVGLPTIWDNEGSDQIETVSADEPTSWIEYVTAGAAAVAKPIADYVNYVNTRTNKFY